MPNLRRTKVQPQQHTTSSELLDEHLENIDQDEGQVLLDKGGNAAVATTLRKRNVTPKQRSSRGPLPLSKQPTLKKAVNSAMKWNPFVSQADEATTSNQPDNFWTWVTTCRIMTPEASAGEYDAKSNQKTEDSKTTKSTTDTTSPAIDEEDTSRPTSQVENKSGDATESEKLKAKSQWLATQKVKSLDLTKRDWKIIAAFSAAAVIIRLWRLSWPNEIVFDELHYVRIINGYLNRQFFIDTHPPLANLITAGIASWAGYNGTSTFNAIGDPYPSSMPLITMRLMPTLAGAICSPMAYVTMKASGHGPLASILAATMVTFDNALVATHRLLLPEGFFFLFTVFTIFSWTLFLKHIPFSKEWWKWLLTSGIALGATISTKTLGLMTFAAMGLAAGVDLWNQAGNVQISSSALRRHVFARLLALIVIPATMYLLVWHIHFSLLTHQPDLNTDTGVSDFRAMSRNLQHSLKGPVKEMRMYKEVAYGSVVRIQSEYMTGVVIHSSYKQYEGGSKQQVVSGSVVYDDSSLAYDDPNTHWIVAKARSNVNDTDEIPYKTTYLKNGDVLRLRHVPTRHCLHSHNIRPESDPNNKQVNEVSGYGTPKLEGDPNDLWVVQIVEEGTYNRISSKEKRKVYALETRFRLRHRSTGCYLYTADAQQHERYGKGRYEILCRTDAKINPRSIWRVTLNLNDYLTADAELASYPKVTFFDKLKEVHELMMRQTVQWSLVESPVSPSASRPSRWPLLRTVIPAWRSYKRQIFIYGNPIVWGICATGLISLLGLRGLMILRDKRGYTDGPALASLRPLHINWSTQMAAGWAIHYIPFVFLKRGLFLYHYYPAFYLSLLIASSMLSGVLSLFVRPVRLAVLAIIISCTIHMFWTISPLTYGSVLRREACEWLTKPSRLWRIDPNWGHAGGNVGLSCSLTPPAHQLVPPLTELMVQAKSDKILWAQRVEEYRKQSRALPDSSQMPQSIFGQVRAVSREQRRPKPVMEQNYPPESQLLPREDVWLAPYQRPPQWHSARVHANGGGVGGGNNPRPAAMNYAQRHKERFELEFKSGSKEREENWRKIEERMREAEAKKKEKEEQEKKNAEKALDGEKKVAEEVLGGEKQDTEELLDGQPRDKVEDKEEHDDDGEEDDGEEYEDDDDDDDDDEGDDGDDGDDSHEDDNIDKSDKGALEKAAVDDQQKSPEHAPLVEQRQVPGQDAQPVVINGEASAQDDLKGKVDSPDDDDDDAEEGGDDEDEKEVEVETVGPPISVKSPEELEAVLASLKEAGIRAEVVRGTKTETLEADEEEEEEEED
ncbi:hypothetical protein BGW42_000852 [Actinomortierella wolfii]|nr:hypothetical protein BGW42_000852 [Actinomortierella wolfii]